MRACNIIRLPLSPGGTGQSVMIRRENDPRYQGWRVAGASGVGVFFASILVYSVAVLVKPLAGPDLQFFSSWLLHPDRLGIRKAPAESA